MLSSSSPRQLLAPQGAPVQWSLCSEVLTEITMQNPGLPNALFFFTVGLKIMLHLFLLMNTFLEAGFLQPTPSPPSLPGAAQIGLGVVAVIAAASPGCRVGRHQGTEGGFFLVFPHCIIVSVFFCRHTSGHQQNHKILTPRIGQTLSYSVTLRGPLTHYPQANTLSTG